MEKPLIHVLVQANSKVDSTFGHLREEMKKCLSPRLLSGISQRMREVWAVGLPKQININLIDTHKGLHYWVGHTVRVDNLRKRDGEWKTKNYQGKS